MRMKEMRNHRLCCSADVLYSRDRDIALFALIGGGANILSLLINFPGARKRPIIHFGRRLF